MKRLPKLRPVRLIQRFFALESSGALVLAAATIAALWVSNSGFGLAYERWLAAPLGLDAGDRFIGMSVLHWINDGLMALFFLVVGIEIKRELVEGELSSRAQAFLPCAAAAGGVVAPALIYFYFNPGETARGWAIPCATDIAFSLGLLILFGARVPHAMKIFLMALAVIDDLIAIIIIALFYTSGLNTGMLLCALMPLTVLFLLARLRIRSRWPYMLAGAALWVCVLLSGIHATIAGVLLGLLLPLGVQAKDERSIPEGVEHALHPWVAYAIVPLFAFANAGVPLAGITGAALLAPVPLGIALGLILGKPLGIYLACRICTALKLATLPEGLGWGHILALGAVAGIGFTMSLFIGLLAFPGAETQHAVRVGVLAGSLVSAILGTALLMFMLPRPHRPLRGMP